MDGFVKEGFELRKKDKYLLAQLPYGNGNTPVKKIPDYMRSYKARATRNVYNARQLQEGCEDLAAFFDKHGFVLLKKPTQVKEWNQDYVNLDTDITRIYHKEIEELIRGTLYKKDAGIHRIQQDAAVLKRGEKSENPFYAVAVHQDYGLTPRDYMGALNAYTTPGLKYGQKWLRGFEEGEATGMAVVCFWRPINMKGPLKHCPLAVMDRATVDRADVIPSITYGFAPFGGQPQALPRINEEQRWYYYPDMTNDEILAFKQFEYHEGDKKDTPYRCCFHTAFKDPTAGKTTEKRKSTEHRVKVYFKN